jgi:glycosyltransferase involved in cell wall biosynthesis
MVIPSLERGGAQTQLVDLVNSLPDDSFEIHLFTFERNLDLKDRLRRTNLFFYSYPRRSRFDLSPARALAAIIDAEGIDLIHCTLQFSLLIASIGRLLSKRRPPVVHALHTTVASNRRYELFNQTIARVLMRFCCSVICVCEAQRRHWESEFRFLKGRTHVVYNGIDVQRFSPAARRDLRTVARSRFGIESGQTGIAYIAGFRPEKGHNLLLTAFAAIRPEYPNVILLLAGDGPMRPALEAQIDSLRLGDSVKLLGNCADVRPVLAAADLTVIASTKVETFSIAMLESMGMGVPMVAADIGGTREAVIDCVNGRLFAVGDVAAFAKTLSEVLADPGQLETFGSRAHKRVSTGFTVDTMARQTADILERAVRDRDSQPRGTTPSRSEPS